MFVWDKRSGNNDADDREYLAGLLRLLVSPREARRCVDAAVSEGRFVQAAKVCV